VPIELLDVAGLVPGAHQGKGLGNKFLDDLRHADALIHVVDVSGTTDAEGEKRYWRAQKGEGGEWLMFIRLRKGHKRLRPIPGYNMATFRNRHLDRGQPHGQMVPILPSNLP
jgi:hypothetical protein